MKWTKRLTHDEHEELARRGYQVREAYIGPLETPDYRLVAIGQRDTIGKIMKSERAALNSAFRVLGKPLPITWLAQVLSPNEEREVDPETEI